MHFADRKFRRNNVVVLSFRKALSRKSNTISVLVDEACEDLIDKLFNKIFSKPVQDLAERKVANELSAD